MFLSDLFELTESVLPLRGGRSVNLVRNPPVEALLALLDRSQDKEMRGLMVGTDVFWWDAYEATHGDVASVYDPDFHDLTRLIEYKKHRLALRVEEDGIRMFSGSTHEELEAHPRTSRLIKRDIPLTTTYKNF
jgi:hypothetical protein